MIQSSSQILFWLPLIPLIGAFVIGVLPVSKHRLAGIISLTLILAVILLTIHFNSVVMPWHTSVKIETITASQNWIPLYNIHARVTLDGYSGWMILTAAITAFFAILYGIFSDRNRNRYITILIILASSIGIFIAKDPLTLLFAWGLWLLIPFTMASTHNKQHKDPNAMKFFCFHLLSFLSLMAGLGLVYFAVFNKFSSNNFDITSISQLTIPLDIQLLILVFLTIATAIRMPIFPFHGWLSDYLADISPAVSAVLTANSLATGSYVLIRFVLPLCPDVILSYNRYFIFIAMITMVYGALVALMNPHILQRLGFASLGYSGFLLMGIFALNDISLAGTALMSVNYMITIVVLILATGWISQKADSALLQDLGGIWKKSPLMAGVFLVASLAFVGVPGLCLFPGMFLVVGGTLMSQPAWAAVSIIAFLILAAGILWMFQQIFTGQASSRIEQFEPYSDTAPGRILIPLTAMIIWFGFFPQYMIQSMKNPLDSINQHINSHRIFRNSQSDMSPLELLFRRNRSIDKR